MACSVFQVSCPFAGLAEKKTFMIKVVDSLSEGDKRQKKLARLKISIRDDWRRRCRRRRRRRRRRAELL